MRYKIILIVNIIFTTLSISQTIDWEKNYGGSEDDEAQYILKTSDNNYLVIGNTYSSDGDVSGNYGDQDIWILKLDSNGDILWDKNIGGTGWDIGTKAIETNDGNFLVFSNSSSNEINSVNSYGSSDGWIHKISMSGELEWSKNYGGSGSDYFRSAKLIDDNDFVVVGYSHSDDFDLEENAGNSDYWIMKINENGIVQWSKSWGTQTYDRLQDVSLTFDGGFITLGCYQDQIALDELRITKLSNDGIMEWEKSFVGNNNDVPVSILQATDGNYIACAHSNSTIGDVGMTYGERDYWLFKIDQTGSIIWNYVFGGTSIEVTNSCLELSNGDLILSGYSGSNDIDVTSNNGLIDKWILKLDSQGNFMWEANFGGSDADGSKYILETEQYKYVSVGFSSSSNQDVSNNNGGKDIWITAFSEASTSIPSIPSINMSIMPNPSNGNLVIKFNAYFINAKYKLVNNIGQIIKSGSLTGKSCQLKNIPKGFYFFILSDKIQNCTSTILIN